MPNRPRADNVYGDDIISFMKTRVSDTYRSATTVRDHVLVSKQRLDTHLASPSMIQ